jgi:glucokinase
MVRDCAVTIILGSPASGKTSLAARLAANAGVACFCKDDVKESLFDELGTGEREWSRTLSRASFAVLLRLAQTQIAAQVPCILEGNWGPLHTPGLHALLSRGGVRFAQILCRADPAQISQRFLGRQRHAGHLDDILAGELASQMGAPPPFLELPGKRWEYASDDPAAFPGLLREWQAWLHGAASDETPVT